METTERGFSIFQEVRFTGEVGGRKCDFPATILKAHPSIPGVYHIRAVFAHNALFTPDWADERDLELLRG